MQNRIWDAGLSILVMKAAFESGSWDSRNSESDAGLMVSVGLRAEESDLSCAHEVICSIRMHVSLAAQRVPSREETYHPPSWRRIVPVASTAAGACATSQADAYHQHHSEYSYYRLPGYSPPSV